MSRLLSPRQHSFVLFTLLALSLAQLSSCSSNSSGGAQDASNGGTTVTGTGGTIGTGGKLATGGGVATGGIVATGGTTSTVASLSGGNAATGGGNATGGTLTMTSVTGGKSATGGMAPTGGSIANGGSKASGGATSDGGTSSAGGTTQCGNYVVAMMQSTKAQATDLTQSDVADLVEDAVERAGGLTFIHDGQTVVLKPNLVTAYANPYLQTPASPTVNGISTDWRVVKAVADLVRAKNPTGQILVMEGSVLPTATAYSLLGYTTENFGTSVDQFIALEGASCGDVTTTALVQRTSNGKTFWVNKQYVTADVVISIPTMKTHTSAGITGSVKNLGVGTTPVGMYSAGTGGTTDCSRGQTSTYIDHTSPETLGQFIHDYYSIRPADFVVMDALQGLEHGPHPVWDNSGTYDLASSQKNMRLILAGKNAVAVDTVEALVMKCDPTLVPHLTKLEADGLGTTDITKITVVGKQISEVAKPFAGKQTAICPGQ